MFETVGHQYWRRTTNGRTIRIRLEFVRDWGGRPVVLVTPEMLQEALGQGGWMPDPEQLDPESDA